MSTDVRDTRSAVGVTLLATLLWLIVLAGLAYGIEETVRKAATLFTG